MRARVEPAAIVWRQLDTDGLEHARVWDGGDAPRLDGAVVMIDRGTGWRLAYRVECDGEWRTRAARVEAVCGASDRGLSMSADAQGRWTVDGAPRPDLEGCLDVDLGFTPSTNTLAIRRLGLAVGQSAPIEVAWLDFPDLTVHRTAQRYTRLAGDVYRFEQPSARFTADLEVDSAGVVVTYPALWTRLQQTPGAGGA